MNNLILYFEAATKFFTSALFVALITVGNLILKTI